MTVGLDRQCDIYPNSLCLPHQRLNKKHEQTEGRRRSQRLGSQLRDVAFWMWHTHRLTVDRSCLYRTKSTRPFNSPTRNTNWTPWGTGGSAHMMGWGLGVPRGNGRGVFEMNMAKIHYLHVYNWQRILERHPIKKKSMYQLSESSVCHWGKWYVGWLTETLRKNIHPLKSQIPREGQEAHRMTSLVETVWPSV